MINVSNKLANIYNDIVCLASNVLGVPEFLLSVENVQIYFDQNYKNLVIEFDYKIKDSDFYHYQKTEELS